MNKATNECIMCIYDCVIDRNSMPEMLDKISFYSNAKSAIIFAADYKNPEININKMANIFDESAQKTYVEKFREDDESAVENLQKMPAQKWLRDSDHYESDLINYGLHKWLSSEFSICHRSYIRLNDNPVWFDGLSLFFEQSRGNITDEEVKNFSPLLPHLAKLIELDRPFGLLKARYNAVLAVLDRLHIGVCLVGADGTCLLRNKEFSRIADLKDGLWLDRRDQLRFQSEGTSAVFLEAIAYAIRTASGAGLDAGARFTVARPSGGTRFLIETDPLRSSHSELNEDTVCALVLVIDPDNFAPIKTDGMRELFDLTLSEESVLQSLLEGRTAVDISDIRRTKPATVLTQIQSIARKTYTKNRSELVRLALMVNPPIEIE